MKIRIKDIAVKAGVSEGTVDRVLHNRGEVSEKTRRKVLKIIKESDYQPDIMAKILSSKKDFRIIAYLPDSKTSISYWGRPLVGIRKGIKEICHFGAHLEERYFNYYEKKDFVAGLKNIIKEKPDGLLIAPVYKAESEKYLRECDEAGIPYVFIDTDLLNANALSFIGQDSYKSGQLAARIINFGLHKNEDIAIISITDQRDNIAHLTERINGFQDFFEKLKSNKTIHLFNIHLHPGADSRVFQSLEVLKNEKTIGLFVPNSRVYKVAEFIEKNKIKGKKMLGYDITDENISYLKKQNINFLISQKPEQQGYLGIISLFNKKVLNQKIEAKQFMPIDIITNENIEFYK